MSYPADSDTLEHLHPLTTKVQVLIKTIHSIRTQKKVEEITFRVPKEPPPPSLLRLIGSKNSFKEILDEKMKNEAFRTDMTWKRRLQRMMCDVMGHSIVEVTIMGFILANTVVLAVDHHQIDSQFKKVLDVLNLVRCHYPINQIIATVIMIVIQILRAFFVERCNQKMIMIRDRIWKRGIVSYTQRQGITFRGNLCRVSHGRNMSTQAT